MIVIVFGLPGSGKSSLASRLASLIKAVYINSDSLRRKMLPSRMYTDEEKLSVYDEMLLQMKEVLKQKKKPGIRCNLLPTYNQKKIHGRSQRIWRCFFYRGDR